MTSDEAKNLPKGTLVRWLKYRANSVALAGATAKCIDFDGYFVIVEWIRNGLDGGQKDGGYLPRDFEIVTGSTITVTASPSQPSTAVKTQPCNCSTFDFTRYGCVYLQKADSKGFFHS